MDTSLDAIAAAVRPSVVQVLPGSSGGAGVVLSRGGELVVVTNAHVARGSAGNRVRILSHRRTAYTATIERADAGRDLALLTLDAVRCQTDLRAIGGADAAVPVGFIEIGGQPVCVGADHAHSVRHTWGRSGR